jgi:type IV secretion system protein VirB6
MKALILYLLATLAISLLLIVAPIYISFMLFDRTKPLFDAWIKSLISYTLQPAMVFTALAIFNVFVFSSLYSLLYYKVCWQEIWTSYWKLKDGTTIEIGSFLNFYHPVVPLTLGDGTERVSGLSLQDMSTPTQFFLIMIFLIICASLIRFIDWMADAASELVTGNKAGSLSAVSNSTMNKGVAIMSQIASETLSKVAGPAVKKMAEAVQKQRQKDKQKRQAGQSEKK